MTSEVIDATRRLVHHEVRPASGWPGRSNNERSHNGGKADGNDLGNRG